MKPIDYFSRFVDIVSLAECEFTADNVFRFTNLRVDAYDSLPEILRGCGYNFDSAKTIRNEIVTIKNETTAWGDGRIPIYQNWDQLLRRVEQTLMLPEYFFVLSDKSSHQDSTNKHFISLKLYVGLIKVLTLMSDHAEPTSGDAKGRDKLLFLIDSATGIQRFEFSPKLNWPDLESLLQPTEDRCAVQALHDALVLSDCQQKERRAVMRTALCDLLSKNQRSQSEYLFILKHVHEFLAKYHEHWEIFINKFSVNKVIQDINQQELQYVAKINDNISSGQSKALAVPGALVAISALMKISGVFEGVALMLGVWLTTLIILKALAVHEATFLHIQKQIVNEFERYHTISEKAEIRSKAKGSEKALLALVTKASDGLIQIKRIVVFTLIACLLYICISLTFIHKVWLTMNISNIFWYLP